MVDTDKQGQSGGVNVYGGKVTARDIVGRDKVVGTEISKTQLDEIFQPLVKAVATAPPEKQPEAEQKVQQLKTEVAKGADANDGVMAKLVDGLIELVPSAVGALVSAFATPLLGGIAGPTTKYILERIQHK